MKKTNLLMSILAVFMLLSLSSCRHDRDNFKKMKDVVCGEECQAKKKEEEAKKKEEEAKKKEEEAKKKEEEAKKKEEEAKKKEEEAKNREEEISMANKKEPFVTLWWVGEDRKISVPLSGQYFDKYNYTARWSNIDNPNLKGVVVVYRGDIDSRKGVINLPEPGEYRLEIIGEFPAIYFFASGYKDHIRRIEQWGGIEWETMKGAFTGCKNLQITAKDAPDLSRVRDMSYMFEGNRDLNQSINHWDVGNVVYMNGLFKDAERFNQPLDNWRVDNVKIMTEMFKNTKSFNQSLNNWNVGNVITMNDMFSGATAFNQPIGNWNVSNVKNMTKMFHNAKSFNQPIGNWNVSNVTSFFWAFANARSFNQTLNRWDMRVRGMNATFCMFQGAVAFSKKNIISWNLSKDDMKIMFVD